MSQGKILFQSEINGNRLSYFLFFSELAHFKDSIDSVKFKNDLESRSENRDVCLWPHTDPSQYVFSSTAVLTYKENLVTPFLLK